MKVLCYPVFTRDEVEELRYMVASQIRALEVMRPRFEKLGEMVLWNTTNIRARSIMDKLNNCPQQVEPEPLPRVQTKKGARRGKKQ